MKKKKAMKAIAAAGVALGGASYFQDANVVYVQAAENDGSTETVIEASEASETKEAEKTEEKPSETKAAESTETKGETSADGAGAPADGAGAPADGAGAPADGAGAPADDTGASTDNTLTDVSKEEMSNDVTTPEEMEDGETSGSDTVIPPTGGTPDEITDETTGGASEGSEGGSEEEDNLSETQEGSESTGPWSEAESTSTVNSTEFSNSYSEVTSVSEVGSASLSTETSEYTSTSESTSTVESTSMSKAESEYTSLSTAASEATSTYGSASTSLDSAYTSEVQSTASEIESVRDSALADDQKISDKEAQDLAQAIIKYDLASEKATLNKIEWDEALSVYRVSYIDSNGVVLQKLYQYKVNDDRKDVTVNEAKVEYTPSGTGTTTTVTGVSNNGNNVSTSTGEASGSAPEIKYEIKEDGTVYIEVDGTEYWNPERQVNADGTFSYILDKEGDSDRKLLNLDRNGKVTSYTTYEKNTGSGQFVDGSGSGVTISDRGGYTATGGTPDNVLWGRYQYIVVTDQTGSWHKLVYKKDEIDYQITVGWDRWGTKYSIGYQKPNGTKGDIQLFGAWRKEIPILVWCNWMFP